MKTKIIPVEEIHIIKNRTALIDCLGKNGKIRNDTQCPLKCLDVFLDKKSIDSKDWGEKSGVKIESLFYYSAVNHNGGFMGFSGFYRIDPDIYLKKENSKYKNEILKVNSENGKAYWVGWTIVLKEWQGQGVGTHLVSYIVKQIKSEIIMQSPASSQNSSIDYDQWFLYALVDTEAINNFVRWGFERTGIIIDKDHVLKSSIRTLGRKIIHIEPLSEKHLKFAIDLLICQMPEHTRALDKINEGPEICYIHSINWQTGNKAAKDVASMWADNNRIMIERLRYFVAVDLNGEMLGVSGIYSVLPGYLARDGSGSSKLIGDVPTHELEKSNHFWMGWTGVKSEIREQGIEKEMMKYGISFARKIAYQENIQDARWTVLADSRLYKFYKDELGLSFKIEHHDGVIFDDLLHSI